MARMLLVRNELANTEQALALIEDAVATYRELDMHGWAKSALKLTRAQTDRARA
jgi:hypothetical protein